MDEDGSVVRPRVDMCPIRLLHWTLHGIRNPMPIQAEWFMLVDSDIAQSRILRPRLYGQRTVPANVNLQLFLGMAIRESTLDHLKIYA